MINLCPMDTFPWQFFDQNTMFNFIGQIIEVCLWPPLSKPDIELTLIQGLQFMHEHGIAHMVW